MDEQFIGNYRVIQKIGAGGMAKVYLAVHRDVPNLKVILKILSDPRLGERFKQEADKLALLDGHSSICRIKHFFNHGEDTVIAMEYIDGHTLDEAMKSKGGLTAEESARITIAVLDTLDFAHQKKIFHRDIKPSNVMIDTAGNVKIIDFGIAKAESDPNLTVAGTACGTPAYMAPEQFNPADDISYALTDIYAVGTTLYFMLCGQLPFKGKNEFAIRDEKLFSDPTPPSALCKDVPKGVEQVVLKAMSKEPSDRYQSAAEMKQALEALQLSPTTKKDRLAPEPTTDIKTGRSVPKRKSRLPVALGAAAVVVIAALAWLFWPQGSSAPQAPELSRPWDETILDISNRPTFSWKSSVGAGGTYTLQYGTDSSFAESVRKTGLTETSLTPEEGLANGDYFWRVRAVDVEGRRSAYSEIRAFTVEVTPVSAPTGKLLVTVNTASDIYVDGSLKNRSAKRFETETDTGSYAIRVENSRSREKVRRETVRVTAGQTARAAFRFSFPESEPEPPPAEAGKLAVLSIPTGAAVFVDGVVQKDIHTPHTLTLGPGNRVIKVILADQGNQSLETTIKITEGGEDRVMFNFEQDTVLFDF